jgi:hypothetical protein
MKIAIFGTGMVGRTIAAKLVALDHDVMIGTRDIAKTLSRDEGSLPFKKWITEHLKVKLGDFTEAAEFGDLLVNAASGLHSIAILKKAGKKNMRGKVLMDISNPLDFSKGMPPSLFVCNTDSMGEQIQREFPTLKVVKALNTITAALMVNPALVQGDHNVFICGNDETAKAQVVALLKSFGWEERLVIDLGDITAARATEQLLPIWLRLWGKLQQPVFNFNVVVGRF